MSEIKNELTLKVLFGKIRYFFKYLLTKWYIIVIAGVIGASLGFWYANRKPYMYTGELSFVLSNGSGESGFSGLASQFGLDFGNREGDIFSQDNIIALFKSRKMVQRALFTKPSANSPTLLNIYVKCQLLDSIWKGTGRLKNVYPFPDSAGKMTPVQDSLVREIHTALLNGAFTVDKPDKKENVFKVTTFYPNETFACFFTKAMVDETSRFYIETKTSIARQNLNMLLREEDSLRMQLNGSIRTTAINVDKTFNLNPAYQIRRAPIQQTQVETGVLGTAYSEVVRNLELAKINLQKEYPIYQLLDEPTLPLKRKGKGLIKSIFVAGFLFGFITVVYLMLKKLLS